MKIKFALLLWIFGNSPFLLVSGLQEVKQTPVIKVVELLIYFMRQINIIGSRLIVNGLVVAQIDYFFVALSCLL